jgi:hypothetical protein
MFAQDACVPTKSHVQSNFQRMLKAILFTEKNGFFSFKRRKPHTEDDLQKDVYIRFSDHPLYVTCGARG